MLMDVLCIQEKKTTNCMIDDYFVILQHTQHHLLAQTVTFPQTSLGKTAR